MVVWPIAWLGSVTSLVCGGVAGCCLVRECDLWSVVVWPIAWLGSVTSLVCGGVASCLVRECNLSGLWWCGQLLG